MEEGRLSFSYRGSVELDRGGLFLEKPPSIGRKHNEIGSALIND
jgi:hypothetical protein